MNREELERLAWERIDGVIHPDDGDRLERHLADDARARAVLEALRAPAREAEARSQPRSAPAWFEALPADARPALPLRCAPAAGPGR